MNDLSIDLQQHINKQFFKRKLVKKSDIQIIIELLEDINETLSMILKNQEDKR